MSASPRAVRLTSLATGRLLALLLALLLGGWSMTAQAFWWLIPGIYTPQIYYKYGAVYTRAIVPGPNGRPVYVEYDSSGREAREIGEAVGQFERAQVMSGDAYRSLLQRLQDTQSAHPDAVVMTAEEYRAKSFVTVTGEAVSKPSLGNGSKTVVVRPDEQLYTTDGKDLVLLELPIKAEVIPGDGSKALLLSEAGDILHQSVNSIGLRVGFFSKDGRVAEGLLRDRQAQIHGPLPNVVVTLGGHIGGGAALTDEQGKYSMNYFLPPCPGFTFEYTTPAYLELYYKRFNPRGSSNMPYFMVRQDYDFCNGLGVYSMAAASVIMSMATPMKYPHDFPIDLMVLDGGAVFKDATLGESTRYSAETGSRERKLQDKYDFDGDEKPDWVVPGKKVKKVPEGQTEEIEVFVTTSVEEAELQGIYLSSLHESAPANTEETAPDFTRLIDVAPDFEDRGLLETIGKDDLRDTDVYVFRESTGQLVAERRGLHEDELYKDLSGVDEREGSFRYTIQLRGSAENMFSLTSGDREANFRRWQSAGGFKEEFQRRSANHLKAGETVRIIAINRPTGYMGSVRVELQSAAATGNLLNFPSQRIELAPPNLKVWAERKNRIEYGATKGEEKKQLIGNEGAGLGSDVSVAIYTDWRDQDGSPLPEELADYGYTGRLAKIVAANQLAPAGANNLSQFPIKPGQQVQVIHLPEKVLAKQHLYLQVAGQPENRTPDFSSNGQASGILKYRPTHYVPVKVPLHDEEASELARQAWRKADKEKPELELKKPEPLYAWQYRPELQFSMYELNVKEVRKVDADNQTRQILSEKTPTLSNSDKLLEFYYDLLRSEFNELEAWSYQGQKELVLAVGEQEVKATVGADQTIRFDNFEHLGALDVDDFTTMRLYANNDMANLLWEFAFEVLYLESLNIGFKAEQQDAYYLTADDPALDLKTTLIGYAGRDPERKQPVTVRWSLEGEGRLENSVQTSRDLGVFDNKVIMPSRKGASASVFVEVLDNPQSKASWKKIKVLAGKPARISARTSGQAVALGQGQARIDIDVFDKFDNPVEDGTPVSVSLNDGMRIVEQQLETTGGHAYIVVTGGELDTNNSQAVVSAGQVSVNAQLSIDGLTVALSASTTQANKGERVTLTAVVKRQDGAAAAGVPVIFSAGSGVFEVPYQLTDAGGVAKATFVAGLNARSDTWRADVGFVASDQVAHEVKSAGGTSIEAQDAMLVADVSEPGMVTYNDQGLLVEAAYETSGSLQISSEIEGSVKLGDMADPNLEPLLSLQMSELLVNSSGESEFEDETGKSPAVVDNVEVVRDHPMGGGRSADFKAESRVVVQSNELLRLTDGFGLRLDLKPSSSGMVFDLDGQHQLDYENNILTYRIRTAEGTYSVSVPSVEASRWHRVAVRMQQGEIELYVDGRTARSAYSGSLVSPLGGLVVGGLNARMRSLKVFDWGSSPLISFANGATETTVQVGSNSLVVKSLGNLGRRVPGTELKRLRVAVVSGGERNYVSVLTRNGFADLATHYMRSAPPADMPIGDRQMLLNPVAALIPTAHAWTWEGVWQQSKSAFGMWIPYEDFITVGEQLLYWSQGDPRFEPSKLAFAAIGAATIVPVAKPLKPLLGPAKKFVDAMARFPGARHFAGAIGSAAKAGLSGDYRRLEQLLPFIQIGVALYEDQEAFTFLMRAIQSEDDLWVWVDYLGTLAAEAGGFSEETAAYLPGTPPWLVGVGGIVPYAHALTPRQQVGLRVAIALKKISKAVDDPKKLTPALKELLLVMKDEQGPIRQYLFNGTFLSGLAIAGRDKVRHFIKSSKNWRVPREVVIFAIVYLVQEIQSDRLVLGGDKADSMRKFADLMANAISGRPGTQHGAIFHISQLLAYQLQANYVGGSPKVVGIESVRQAFRLTGLSGAVEESGEKPYRREVDIVLQDDASKGEVWVELKSLAGPFKASWFDNRLSAKAKAEDAGDDATDYYRQFFHDLRLNGDFVNKRNLLDIVGINEGVQHSGNVRFYWYFQAFKQTATRSKPPSAVDVGMARDGFCKLPRGLGNIDDFYKHNFSGSASQMASKCAGEVSGIVDLRDAKSYAMEYMERYADNLGIQDFIDIAKAVGE